MKILFFLENGIGYGHFQRCLLIADELKRKKHDVLFLVQAGSSKIFENRAYPVIRIPFTHRLPTNQAEKILYSLVNRIVADFDPDVIIEDTHSHERFLSLPEVQCRKKILIQRRINARDFHDQIESGIFNEYERILIVADTNKPFSGLSHPDTDLYLRYAEKFTIFGPVFRQANKKSDVPHRYLVKDKINVVVAMGAGGNHYGELDLHSLMERVLKCANQVQDRNENYQFSIFGGVYFKAHEFLNDIPSNVRVYGYEPDLHEVLAKADIVLMRPGFNTVHESLSGNAFIILAPATSYMESQEKWVAQLCEQYTGTHALSKDDDLYEIITKPRDMASYRRVVESAHQHVSKAIEDVKHERKNAARGLLILTEEVSKNLMESIPVLNDADQCMDVLNNDPCSYKGRIIFVGANIYFRDSQFHAFQKYVSDSVGKIEIIRFYKVFVPVSKTFLDLKQLFVFMSHAPLTALRIEFEQGYHNKEKFYEDLVEYFKDDQSKDSLDAESFVQSHMLYKMSENAWQPKFINLFKK